MKKIINWFKDFFYSLTDYALILIIIALIAVVLIWKFNGLFNLGFDKKTVANNETPTSIVSQTENETNNSNPKTNNKESETSNEDNNSSKDNNNSKDDDNSKDNNNSNNDNSKDSDQNQNESTTIEQKDIIIIIPSGSYSSQIAEIIVNSGLVDNKKIFLSRCSELKLDTKLKAGEFIIKSGTELDEIIKILTK